MYMLIFTGLEVRNEKYFPEGRGTLLRPRENIFQVRADLLNYFKAQISAILSCVTFVEKFKPVRSCFTSGAGCIKLLVTFLITIL